MDSVLVIESDDATRGAICELLQLEWPELLIYAARNGETGVAMAQQKRPDLILVESDLPDLTGYQTAVQLRRLPETSSIPLVAITSAAYTANKLAAELCSTCNAWLVKPFSGNRLLQIIRPFTRHLAHIRRSNGSLT